MDMQILKIIIGIAIVLLITGLVYWRLRTRKNKEEAGEFLNKLAEDLYNAMIAYISNLDPSIFDKTLEEVETEVLKGLYDTLWNFVQTEAKTAEEDDQLAYAVLTALNRDLVDKFIDKLIDKFGIKDRIAALYEENKKEVIEDLVEEDKDLQEKFSDESEYNTGDTDRLDLVLDKAPENVAYEKQEDGTYKEIERPEDVELPDEVDIDGDGVEEIGEDGLTDEEREAGVYFDKNGRKHAANGKFV